MVGFKASLLRKLFLSGVFLFLGGFFKGFVVFFFLGGGGGGFLRVFCMFLLLFFFKANR